MALENAGVPLNLVVAPHPLPFLYLIHLIHRMFLAAVNHNHDDDNNSNKPTVSEMVYDAHSPNNDARKAEAWRQWSHLWPLELGFDMAVECGRTGLLIVDEALSNDVC